jgi:energy-converting hydrogenase Eha subunit H
VANVGVVGSTLIAGQPPFVETPNGVDLFGITVFLAFVGLVAIGVIMRIQNSVRASRSQKSVSNERENSA